MKKFLFCLAAATAIVAPKMGYGQSFHFAADTVRASVNGSANVYSFVHNNQHSPLVLKWTISNCDFPATWRTSSAFGICDNGSCYSNVYPNWLWNPPLGGNTFTTSGYADTTSFGDFHLQLNLTDAEAGSHYATVHFTDEATSYSKDVTFVINRWPTSVNNINEAKDISLFPNPSGDQTHISFRLTQSEEVAIQIINSLGQVAANVANEKMNAGVHTVTINTASLSIGIYNVVVGTKEGKVIETLSVVR